MTCTARDYSSAVGRSLDAGAKRDGATAVVYLLAMGFRDESEAMHARLRALETELEEARERVSELEEHSTDRQALAERVRELEAERAAHRAARSPFDGPPMTPSGPAKRPSQEPSKRRRTFHDVVGWLAMIFALVWSGISLIDLDFCGPDLEAEASHGRLPLAQQPTPIARRVTVSGSMNAENTFGSARCRGYVGETPTIALEADDPTELTVTATSAVDTVLVVLAEDGELSCDDDSGDGHDPHVRARVGAGVHRVWVGTFLEDERAQVDLRIEQSP